MYEHIDDCIVHDFISLILCKMNHEFFFNKICVGGIRCLECGSMILFHINFPMDIALIELSYVMVRWRPYEYVKSLGGGISIHRNNMVASGEIQCMSRYIFTVYNICGCVILY